MCQTGNKCLRYFYISGADLMNPFEKQPYHAEFPVSINVSKADRPSILLIDDEPDVLQVLACSLESEGYEVSLCVSPQQASQTADKSRQVDVAIVDMSAARGGTCQFASDLCAAFPNAVILLTTGQSDEVLYSRLKCHRSCTLALLNKPFSLAELRGSIESLLYREPDSSAASRCTGNRS